MRQFPTGPGIGLPGRWFAGRDEEAVAWQSIMTGYSELIKQPTQNELVRRRQPSDGPCTTTCARCSQCIRAESVVSNLARYRSPDFPGTGHRNSRHAEAS